MPRCMFWQLHAWVLLRSRFGHALDALGSSSEECRTVYLGELPVTVRHPIRVTIPRFVARTCLVMPEAHISYP